MFDTRLDYISIKMYNQHPLPPKKKYFFVYAPEINITQRSNFSNHKCIECIDLNIGFNMKYIEIIFVSQRSLQLHYYN